MSHFYNNEGKLMEGNITSARKNGWLPSATTILYIIAKEWGLENWIKDELIKEAFSCCGMHGSPQERIKQVKENQNAKRDAIMDYGSTIHNLMERIVRGSRIIDMTDYEDRIKHTVPALIEWVHEQQINVLDTEKTLVNLEHGFASTYDLHCTICGEEWLIDYKTQSTYKDKPMKSYPENLYQLGAYNILLNDSPKRYGNLYISSTEPGRMEMKEWTQEQITWGAEVFLAALRLYKLIKKL